MEDFGEAAAFEEAEERVASEPGLGEGGARQAAEETRDQRWALPS